MTERIRLQQLSHAQIGALLMAFSGIPMKPAQRGWYTPGQRAWVHTTTFRAMVRLGLFAPRGGGSTAVLTPEGFRLADLAVTLSRGIAAAVAGLPARLPIEAKAVTIPRPTDVPEGEPSEADGSAWDRLPPAVRVTDDEASILTLSTET